MREREAARRPGGRTQPRPQPRRPHPKPLSPPLPLQVKVKRRGDDRKFLARVLCVGVDCDIALLTGAGARGCAGAGVCRGRAAARMPLARPFTTNPHPSPSHPRARRAVDDDEFWEGVSALEFGALPRLQDQVAVVGYPVGGESISITVGVVSRIEARARACSRVPGAAAAPPACPQNVEPPPPPHTITHAIQTHTNKHAFPGD